MNLMNRRKLEVSQRLWFGFGFLTLILTVTVVVAYWQADRADERLNDVTDVRVPLERTVLQMEATTAEIAQSLQDYSRDGSRAHLDRAADSGATFEALIGEFNDLADEDQLRQLGEQVSSLFHELDGLHSEIVSLVGQQSIELETLLADIQEISESVDNRLLPLIGPDDPHTAAKLEAAFSLKLDLLAISTAVSDYASKPDAALQQMIEEARLDFQSQMETYIGTDLTTLEESWLSEIGDDFDGVMNDASHLMMLSDNLTGLLVQHQQMSNEIVAILEDEVQPLVSPELVASANGVADSLRTIRTWTLVLGILGLILGGGLVWMVSRRIVRALKNWQQVAKSVADGHLDKRFSTDIRDEFGQVALMLNQMLENLGRSREALGESEETAWQLLDATTDSVLLMDLRGTILACNETAAERFGKSLEQMIDTSYYDLLPADLMASRKAQIGEVIRTGKPLHFEDDRQSVILDTRIFPVINPSNGRVFRIALFARDITTRKWVEEVTERLGRRNELILESAGEGIYGLDTQGRTTFVNPAAARMLGYRPEDLIGQYHHELVHHSRPNGMPYPPQQCPIYSAFKDGTVHRNVDDEVFWRKDGSSFPVEYTSTPIFEDGNVVGAVVTFRDITERKQVEIALRRSVERYRTLFESSATLIIWVDKQGVIIDCNAQARRALGYVPDEMMGRELSRFVHDEDRPAIEDVLREVLVNGCRYNNRYHMVRKGGGVITVNMNAAAVKDENGEYVRTICMVDEITEPSPHRSQQTMSDLPGQSA